jgi:hypothetical protein
MGKRQSRTIAGENFSTKRALEERIRQILYHYRDNQYLSPNDYAFMLEVLEYHPKYELKIGVGAKAMYVKQNPTYKNTRCFWIVRQDGSETDFSFQECLKETPQRKRFLNACRAAVEADKQAFKRKFFDHLGDETYYCPYTNEPLNFIGSHVDHRAPHTFEKIVEGFISENAIDVSRVKINGSEEDNAFQDTFADKDLERLWVDYHRRHADLQIVSPKANLSLLRTKAA